MLRGLQFWGGAFLLVISFITSPFTTHAKSNDVGSLGTSSSNVDIGNINKDLFMKGIKIRVIRLCNDDESDPGGGTYTPSQNESKIKAGIAEANTVLDDNSGAKIQYYYDEETDLTVCHKDTLANYDCFLNPDLFPNLDPNLSPGDQQISITANDLAQLTECDLNQDGECNKYDTQFLCDTSKQGVRRSSLALDAVGSIPVFLRGLEARRRVKYDPNADGEGQGHWVFTYPTGGYSSCAGNLVVMNTGWWGNLLAHESGHYLCTPHTFGRTPKDDVQAAEQITAVVEKYNLDETDDAKVLAYTYDADGGKIEMPAYPAMEEHRIKDTPPDPNSTIWKWKFPDGVCDASNDTITVEVPQISSDPQNPETYDLQPDRSLVMSYFKGCTGLGQHFSPDQIDRIELALDNHRQHLVSQKVRDCYYSKYNYKSEQEWSDLQATDPQEAFNQKIGFLNQCQIPPDLERIKDFANKKFYPIPKPYPIGDPFLQLMTQNQEQEEIWEEIDLDEQLQKLQPKKTIFQIQDIFRFDEVERSKSQELLTPEQSPPLAPTWLNRFFKDGISR